MEIRYDNSYYSKLIKVKDGNASIEADVEYRKWDRSTPGITVCTLRDVADEAMEEVSRCLLFMANDRVREFNSRDCIEQLFEKLPEGVRDSLLADLVKRYGESAD